MLRRLLLFSLLLLFISSAKAQVPVQVMPVPYQQYLGYSGQVLSGGKLYTYAAGTDTMQATYTNSTGTILNPNPIILDVAGRASVWVTGQAYKFVLEDNFGNIQWVQDNVTVGIFPNANNIFTGNNTFTGITTFTGPLVTTNGGTLNGSFAGNPNFTGTPTFSGSLTFLGTVTFSGTPSFLAGASLMGTFTGDPTFSGNPTFSGTPVFDMAPTFNTGIDTDLIQGITPGGTLAVTGAAGSGGAGEQISIAAGVGDTNSNGGQAQLLGGVGNGGGGGGDAQLVAGAGGSTGSGGAVLVASGASGGGNASGGNVTIASGVGAGTGANGNIVLSPCNGTCSGTGGGGDVVISQGIFNAGTGLQHVRQAGCTTGSMIANTCLNTISWNVPFADTNYTYTCTLSDTANYAALYPGSSAPTTTSVTMTTMNVEAQSVSGTINCIAIHD